MAGGLTRVLAIDVRSQKFGWAVLEGSERLIDWGMKSLSYGDWDDLNGSLKRLIERFDPDLLVVKRYRSHGSNKARQAVEVLVEHALKNEVGFRRVSRKDVQEQFRGVEPFTKYEVALAVSRVFPELSDRLPRIKKTWRREDDRISIFEAVAIATTQLSIEEREQFKK